MIEICKGREEEFEAVEDLGQEVERMRRDWDKRKVRVVTRALIDMFLTCFPVATDGTKRRLQEIAELAGLKEGCDE